ncbi:hypothetical protein EU546_07080 [Candidatus Thorarchaeota archaeon]|nr:MAG: hypothetical protein EU546_07080 [Candidatus Thorarchaeota archaeon]
MSASKPEETPSHTSKSETREKETPPKVYDVVDILRSTGHVTRQYPNGIVLAVRTEGIPDSFGVHVDIVYVVDLRAARFGKGGLAMRSAVLETICCSLERALEDVGMGAQLGEKRAILPWKKVDVRALRAEDKQSWSVAYPTKTVYVIVDAVRPTRDLSWLTDEGRVLTIDELAVARRSDIRSYLPEIRAAVDESKWTSLEKGLERAWMSFLTFLMVVASVSVLFLTAQAGGASMTPISVALVSSLVCALLMYSANEHIVDYREASKTEQRDFSEIGDETRMEASSAANEEKLSLLSDLNFVVSPLMASAAEQLETRDIDGAVGIACSVIDECVRNSPDLDSLDETSLLGSDPGLNRFLGLFSELAVETERESLALAYVGLSQHAAEPIPSEEAAKHISSLSNALYDAGILRPAVKDRVDDLLNQWAMAEAVEYLDKELERSEELVTTAEEAESDGNTGAADSEEMHESETTDFCVLMKEKQDEASSEMPMVFAYDYPDRGGPFASKEEPVASEGAAASESRGNKGE